MPALLCRGGCALPLALASLVSAETGAVSLVEFTWPWPPAEDPDEAATCIAYVVMKRDEGFLLCIPPSFIPEQVLAEGQANEASEGVGPSLEVVAPAVRLTPQGEWRATEGGELVGALVVDLPAAAAASLTVPDVSAFSGAPFMVEEPGFFPLASDVLRQTQEWAVSAFGAARSGYHTAAEEDPVLPKQRAQRPKMHTVATLAQDQANLQELVRGLAKQVAALMPQAAGSNSLAQGPAAFDPPPGLAGPGAQVQAQAPAQVAPLSSVLPPAQHVPKALSQVIGPPPPTRQVPKQPSPQEDLEQQLAVTIGGGDAAPDPHSLASAVLAQSQALVSLVSQLAQAGNEPILDGPSSTSVRGAVGRQRLQQELVSHPGSFAKRIRENAVRRMDPSGLTSIDSPTLVRYLERFGGFGRQKNLGHIAWMVAQCSDHLHRGSVDAASDLLALLLLMLDQAALDAGDLSFGWCLTLQPDPPGSLYQDVSGAVGHASRAFSPLAEQRWVTIGLSYLKEIETISARRGELPTAKKAPTLPPPLPPKVPPEGEVLSKKQQRAAAWAAKRAAAAKEK